jgi:hypothetical protein
VGGVELAGGLSPSADSARLPNTCSLSARRAERIKE